MSVDPPVLTSPPPPKFTVPWKKPVMYTLPAASTAIPLGTCVLGSPNCLLHTCVPALLNFANMMSFPPKLLKFAPPTLIAPVKVPPRMTFPERSHAIAVPNSLLRYPHPLATRLVPDELYFTRYMPSLVVPKSDVPRPQLTRPRAVSYTHLRAHETPEHLVCRLLLEKKKK